MILQDFNQHPFFIYEIKRSILTHMETILKSKSYSLPCFSVNVIVIVFLFISLNGLMQVLQSLNSSDCPFGVNIYKTTKKKVLRCYLI